MRETQIASLKNSCLKNMNELVSFCALLCCPTCKDYEKDVSEH